MDKKTTKTEKDNNKKGGHYTPALKDRAPLPYSYYHPPKSKIKGRIPPA